MKRFTVATIAGALVAAACFFPQQSCAGGVSVGIGIGVPGPVAGYPTPAYYPPAYYGPPAYGPAVVMGPRYGYYGYYGRPWRHHGLYGRYRR
jgi:hypothetical protein